VTNTKLRIAASSKKSSGDGGSASQVPMAGESTYLHRPFPRPEPGQPNYITTCPQQVPKFVQVELQWGTRNSLHDSDPPAI